VLKRAEQGEVVLENEIAAVKDEIKSTLVDDQVCTTPSVKSKDTQSVRQNKISRGSHIRKAKMIKNNYADVNQMPPV
jgi:hypothetical protein